MKIGQVLLQCIVKLNKEKIKHKQEPPKQEILPQKQPSPYPKPSKKEEIREPYPPKVDIVSSSSKGVPNDINFYNLNFNINI